MTARSWNGSKKSYKYNTYRLQKKGTDTSCNTKLSKRQSYTSYSFVLQGFSPFLFVEVNDDHDFKAVRHVLPCARFFRVSAKKWIFYESWQWKLKMILHIFQLVVQYQWFSMKTCIWFWHNTVVRCPSAHGRLIGIFKSWGGFYMNIK